MKPTEEGPRPINIGEMRKHVLSTIRKDNSVAITERTQLHLIAIQNLFCSMQMSQRSEETPTASDVDWMVQLLEGRKTHVNVESAVQFLGTIPVERHPTFLQVATEKISTPLRKFAAMFRRSATSQEVQASFTGEQIGTDPVTEETSALAPEAA